MIVLPYRAWHTLSVQEGRKHFVFTSFNFPTLTLRQLDIAVAEEDYQSAARLRDECKVIRQDVTGGTSLEECVIPDHPGYEDTQGNLLWKLTREI